MTTQRSDAVIGNSVIAVRFGEWKTRRAQVFLDYDDLDEPDGPHTVAYYFWVIRTPERTILVDTGFNPDVAARRGRHTLIKPVDAFAAMGLQEDSDIDLVLTHGHYDHIGNVDWFRAATIYMARTEYDFWQGPLARTESSQSLAEPHELQHLVSVEATGRLQLLDAQHELAPGVELIPAPGHTPGELMVRIDTAEGVVLLTSDAAHFDEELARGMPFRHMTDVPASHTTFAAIRDMGADHIIAGHEDSLTARYPTISGPLSGYAIRIAGDDLTSPLETLIQRGIQ